MRSDFSKPFERELALDQKLSEDYVESLVMQGYSSNQIVRQAEALRNGTPLDELPLDLDPDDYYDYLSGGWNAQEEECETEPDWLEYAGFDPNAPDDF